MDVYKMEHTVLAAAIPGPNPPDEVVSDRSSNNNHVTTQGPPSYEDPDDDDHQQFALPFFDSSPTTTSVATTTTVNGHHNCHNVIPKKECFEERAPCVYESSDVTPDTLFSEKDYGHYAASSPPPGLTVLYGATELKNQTQHHHQHLGHQHHQQHHIHHQTQAQALKTQPATSTTKSTAKADQSFAAPDSNSNTPTKTFIPCKVCGDKASGYHYGVTSCEGCKGFFRRSIQKQIEYRCLRDGKCLVIRLNRNRCQYCRFKKCLAVGMSRDSVRYGRVPKRNRERNDEARVTQSEADQSAKDAENKQLAIYDIILTVSQAHHANCSYTEERIRGLMRKPAIFNLSDLDGDMGQDTADSLENQKIIMWQHFAIYVTPSIQRVVEFAKRVPGFSALTQDDQLILIKAGFFEIWLLHIARMVNSIDNTMMFCDGSYVDRQQLDLVFDHEFVTDMFTFAMTFNNLQLNDTEIGLFAAVILLTYDRPGISDQNSIEIHREKLVEALRLQVARNHAGDAHFYPTVTDKVTLLRALGTRHAQHLHWFRINWAKLKLPPLFAEIFDIPKCEEDLQ